MEVLDVDHELLGQGQAFVGGGRELPGQEIAVEGPLGLQDGLLLGQADGFLAGLEPVGRLLVAGGQAPARVEGQPELEGHLVVLGEVDGHPGRRLAGDHGRELEDEELLFQGIAAGGVDRRQEAGRGQADAGPGLGDLLLGGQVEGVLPQGQGDGVVDGQDDGLLDLLGVEPGRSQGRRGERGQDEKEGRLPHVSSP